MLEVSGGNVIGNRMRLLSEPSIEVRRHPLSADAESRFQPVPYGWEEPRGQQRNWYKECV